MKKVMRFESRKGPKKKRKGKNMLGILFLFLLFLIIPFHLHFKDDF